MAPNTLQVRDVSCFCSKKNGVLICPCFSPFDACVVQAVPQVNNDKRSSTHPDVMLTHRPTEITMEHVDQWCIVHYYGRAYPGIIKCVEDGDRFFWPYPPDDINWYDEQEIICFIPEPSYASRRHGKVDAKIWEETQRRLP